jgi:hypothetical protein
VEDFTLKYKTVLKYLAKNKHSSLFVTSIIDFTLKYMMTWVKRLAEGELVRGISDVEEKLYNIDKELKNIGSKLPPWWHHYMWPNHTQHSDI